MGYMKTHGETMRSYFLHLKKIHNVHTEEWTLHRGVARVDQFQQVKGAKSIQVALKNPQCEVSSEIVVSHWFGLELKTTVREEKRNSENLSE